MQSAALGLDARRIQQVSATRRKPPGAGHFRSDAKPKALSLRALHRIGNALVSGIRWSSTVAVVALQS